MKTLEEKLAAQEEEIAELKAQLKAAPKRKEADFMFVPITKKGETEVKGISVCFFTRDAAGKRLQVEGSTTEHPKYKLNPVTIPIWRSDIEALLNGTKRARFGNWNNRQSD